MYLLQTSISSHLFWHMKVFRKTKGLVCKTITFITWMRIRCRTVPHIWSLWTDGGFSMNVPRRVFSVASRFCFFWMFLPSATETLSVLKSERRRVIWRLFQVSLRVHLSVYMHIIHLLCQVWSYWLCSSSIGMKERTGMFRDASCHSCPHWHQHHFFVQVTKGQRNRWINQ